MVSYSNPIRKFVLCVKVAMGCSGTKAKIGVEASMQEVRANPLQGLPLLKDALAQRASPGQEESAKRNVPQVFELLAKAIGDLKVKDRRAVVDACAVIELCVNLANNPSIGSPRAPAIDPENIRKCINQFSPLLEQIQFQGGSPMMQSKIHPVDDADTSAEAIAIAGAIQALFRLEDHAAACRQEVTKDGLKIAVTCLRNDSGLRPESRQAILRMLAALLEEPQSAQYLIENQRSNLIHVLVPYCIDPNRYCVSKKFQLLCAELLETCIKNGQNIKNKADAEAAIENVKAAIETRR